LKQTKFNKLLYFALDCCQISYFYNIFFNLFNLYIHTQISLVKLQLRNRYSYIFFSRRKIQAKNSYIIDMEGPPKFHKSNWRSFNITHPFTELGDLEGRY